MIAQPSNAFGFPAAAEDVPHGNTSPAPTAPPPDPTAAGDKVREKAGLNLSQLTWTFPDGTRRHPVLTSSRWALYEALRQTVFPTPATDDHTRILALANSQRFLAASILLWLCLHEPEAWEVPRENDVALIHDWQALYSEIRRWTDENIPPARLNDAVQLGDLLVDLTFSALPVRRASEGDPDPDEAQKKTHP